MAEKFRKYLLLLAIFGCILPCSGFAQEGQLSSVRISPPGSLPSQLLHLGFNLGFLQHVDFEKKALRQIRSDGFTDVRFYELWTRKRKDPVRDVVADIDKVVADGFVPLVCLSNFPVGFPTNEQKKSRWLKGLGEGQRKKISTQEAFVNRFPPLDAEGEYSQLVNKLLGALSSRYGKANLRQWLFEIGNEPDAALFFWGSPGEFPTVFKSAFDAIKSQDSGFRVGGSGFTTGLLKPDLHDKPYYPFAQGLAQDPRVDFVSFHLYENYVDVDNLPSAFGSYDFNPPGKLRVISEWNVDVAPAKANVVINSPAFMSHLIKVVYECYVSNVSYLYVHKLMDNPQQKNSQLGLFSGNGTPKAGYGYFRMIKDVVKDGYYGEKRGGAIILSGRNSIAVLAERHLDLDLTGMNVVESSFSAAGSMVTMESGSWLIAVRGK